MIVILRTAKLDEDGSALFKYAGTHNLVNITHRVFIQKPDGIGSKLICIRFVEESVNEFIRFFVALKIQEMRICPLRDIAQFERDLNDDTEFPFRGNKIFEIRVYGG